jgi:cholesterol transport system auxiliary component
MTTKTQFAPTRRALLVSAAATFVLAGCGSLLSPSNPPSRIYVLEPPFGKVPGPMVNWGLAITPTDVPNVFDTDRVSLSRDLAMDYFADTQWTDTNSRLLQSLLVEAFEKSGRIGAVARDSGGVHGDYLLTSELRHFEAVYDNGDGAPEIRVEIEAKLLSLSHRDMVATHDAVQKVRASANSVPAVVAAFNAATGAAISEIVDWSLAAPGAQYASATTTDDATPTPVHHRRRRR